MQSPSDKVMRPKDAWFLQAYKMAQFARRRKKCAMHFEQVQIKIHFS